MAGKLWGVGVGPGDPELLTVKAAKLLAAIPVVFVPKAREGQLSLAGQIARSYLSPQARIREVVMPMTAAKEELVKAWEKAAMLIREELRQGHDAAFLTLGDPSLYSTFTYVHQALKRLAPTAAVEIIPGINSFAAAAARVGIPLAEGDEPLVVFPNGGALPANLPAVTNVILMKVSRDYQQLVADLVAAERLEKAIFVSRVGQEQELITKDLTSLTAEKIDYLSLIISK